MLVGLSEKGPDGHLPPFAKGAGGIFHLLILSRNLFNFALIIVNLLSNADVFF